VTATATKREIAYGCAHGVEDGAACEAIRRAAMVELDQALMDIVECAQHPTGSPRLASARYLPARYREAYDLHFLKQWTLCLAIVGYKLAHGVHLRLSCTAEQLALHALITAAEDWAREHDEPPPALDGLRASLGDRRFEALYDGSLGAMADDVRFERWFASFDEFVYGPLHPTLSPR
jgi:hypothetical protein